MVPPTVVTPSGLPLPFARSGRERDDAWERCLHYVLAVERGERRSYARTGAHFGVHASSIAEQAERYDWASRCILLDEALSQNAMRDAASAVKKATVSQVRLAGRIATIAESYLAAIEHSDGALDDDSLAQAKMAAELVERSQKISRLALGQSTSNSSHMHTVNGAEGAVQWRNDGATPEQRQANRDAARYSLSLLGCSVPGYSADAAARGRDELMRRAMADLRANPPAPATYQPNQ